MSLLVVVPLVIVLMKMRPTVAVEAVAMVDSPSDQRSSRTNDPLVASAVNARKMSVPTVPPPCDDVLAAVTATAPIRPAFE